MGHLRYVRRIHILFAILLAPYLHAQGTLAITSPASGANVSLGTTLSVEFSASSDVTNIMLVSDLPNGIVVETSAPGVFALPIPASTSIRQYTLNLIGVSNGKVVSAAPVTINADTPLAIRSVEASPGSLYFDNIGDVLPLHVIGTLSDGSKADVTHSASVTFAVENPGVASINNAGSVTAIGSGKTFITITTPAGGYSVYTIVSEAAPLAPTFSPLPGTFTSSVLVGLSETSVGATIYYTSDTSLPLSQWQQYSSPFTISSSSTISAYARSASQLNSPVVSGAFTILAPAALPVFSPPGGTYSAAQTVSIADVTPGATIYYTTDGSSPVTSSTQYTSPITIARTAMLRAIAVAGGYAPSAEVSANYTINTVAPDFSMTLSPQVLQLKTGDSGKITLSINQIGGFASAITFACSGLPAGASCGFSPSSLTPTSSTSSEVVTISTGSLSASERGSLPLQAVGLGTCFAFCLTFRRLARRWPSLLAIAVTIGVIGLTSCGSNAPKTSTSTVTITALSGTVQHIWTLQLQVNQ
jgi:hypothetical protein